MKTSGRRASVPATVVAATAHQKRPSRDRISQVTGNKTTNTAPASASCKLCDDRATDHHQGGERQHRITERDDAPRRDRNRQQQDGGQVGNKAWDTRQLEPSCGLGMVQQVMDVGGWHEEVAVEERSSHVVRRGDPEGKDASGQQKNRQRQQLEPRQHRITKGRKVQGPVCSTAANQSPAAIT